MSHSIMQNNWFAINKVKAYINKMWLAHDDAPQCQVWLQKVQWFRICQPRNVHQNFEPLIQLFQKVVMLMMMIHFNFKSVSSSIDTVEKILFVYMNFHCDFDLEGSHSITSNNTLGDASLCKFWSQKFQQSIKYLEENSLKNEAIAVTLTCNPVFLLDTKFTINISLVANWSAVQIIL